MRKTYLTRQRIGPAAHKRCVGYGMVRGSKGSFSNQGLFFMKHPPIQIPDDEAYRLIEGFIKEMGAEPAALNVSS